MVDTTFRTILPPLKAVDNLDGTYSLSASIISGIGSLGATCWVVANDAKAETKAFAQILQAAGYPVWVCDGVDDQVEIQAAIDAIIAHGGGGGKIVFSEGTFYISQAISLDLTGISLGITFEGQGALATVIRAVPGNNINGFQKLVAATAFFMTFRDMQIRGNDGAASGSGIYLNNSGDCEIINCFIQHWKDYCVRTIPWNFKMRGCTIEYAGNYGLLLGASQDAKIIGNKFIANHNGIICDAYASSFIGNYIQANDQVGITLSGSRGENTITSNVFVRNSYTSPGVYSDLAVRGDNNTIVGNIFDGDSKSKYGIYLYATADNNIITGNTFTGHTTKAIVWEDLDGNIIYAQHSDLFTDVLAASANYIVNAQNLVNGAVVLTGTQPKYSRGLDCTITEVAGNVTGYTMTVVGTNARGNTITDVFTFTDDGLTFSSNNAFDNVTSVTLADVIDTGNATFVMGIDTRLGLKNVIYETSDVWKIIKNGVKQTVAVAQVDVDYDIYDMSVITLAATDDFEIWYRSNLNIIS